MRAEPDGSQDARPDWPQVPGWTLEAELGAGASGRVFRARRAVDGALAALKVLAPRGPHEPDRFGREVEALRALDHPAIPRLLAAGETPAGLRWLAQELVEGMPLAELLALRVLGPAALAGVLAQVARALAAAHAQGVIHRDLKPENVVLDTGLRAALIDFGLARLGAPLTTPGTALGTPAYMAPEMLSAGAASASPAVDVWSLGVVLHEGLAGRHPFADPDLGQTVARVLRASPPPLPPGTPAELVVACQRALSLDPQDRPGVGELAALLERAAAPRSDPPAASRAAGAGPPAPEPSPVAPAAPANVGPYVLEGRLGSGGGGEVWIARHQASGARHALKLLPPRASALARTRFEREAQALARVPAHPGVVAVHHQGHLPDGRPYFSMELVPGETLRAALGRGRLAPTRVARLGAVLARALAHVHAHGVVHRDVKPENVVLRAPGGDPVLVDFGVALDRAEDRLTRPGLVVGTCRYMAPEQVRALGDVGPPADVFALGLVLWEALAGAHPLGELPTLVALAALSRAALPSCDSLPGDAPPSLRAALEAALRLAPGDRPSAAQLAGWLERGERPRARGRAARGLAAAGLALGLVVLATWPRGRHLDPAESAAALAALESSLERGEQDLRRVQLGLREPAQDPLGPARRALAALEPCCARCPVGAALERLGARLARAEAPGPGPLDPLALPAGPQREDALLLAARLALEAGDPARSLGWLARGAPHLAPDDPAAEARALLLPRAAAALGGALLGADPARTAARLAEVGGLPPEAGSALVAALTAAPPEAAAQAVLALAAACGRRSLPPALGRLLAEEAAARSARGEVAVELWAEALALDPAAPLPETARAGLVEFAHEVTVEGREQAPERTILAELVLVRAGLRGRELSDRRLSEQLPHLDRALARQPDDPALVLLQALSCVAARWTAGDAAPHEHELRAAAERLEALALEGGPAPLPESSRSAALQAAARARSMLDPGAAAAWLEQLLARPELPGEPWRLLLALSHSLPEPAARLDWARRAAALAASEPRLAAEDRELLERHQITTLLECGGLDEAETRLDAARELLDDHWHLLRARLLEQRGRAPEALQAIDRFLAVRPLDEEALRLRRRLLALLPR